MTSSQSQSAGAKKRLIRFSLRTALIVVTLLCAGLGWWVVRAERQRAAVEAVREAGGRVHYTYERDPDGGFLDKPKPWAPAWLRKTFGEDLFITLDGIYFERQSIDDAVVVRLVPKLRRVPTLRWLELRDSSISDLALSRIAELTQLERLFIRSSAEDLAPRTKITDAGLARLRTLRGLRHLSLGGCTIDGAAFEYLGPLRRLEGLDLRDTEFNDAAARHLKQFSRLTYLNLWSTPITDSAIEHIGDLRRLEELYFSENKLTDAATLHLAKLTSLKVLDVSQTQISDAGVLKLESLAQLRELRLSTTLIEDPKVDAFRNLQNLKIARTRASDALLERASRLPELRYLDCCDCEHITDAGIKHLENSKSLERLFFPHYRTISDAALQSLQQAKPKLVINF